MGQTPIRYRGYDCRNNISVCVESGAIVYHVAAVGIVLDPVSNVQRHYLAHTDDILCLCMHPAKDIAATGQVGRAAVVNVWTADGDLQTLASLTGHEVGVCAVDFSRWLGCGCKLIAIAVTAADSSQLASTPIT